MADKDLDERAPSPRASQSACGAQHRGRSADSAAARTENYEIAAYEGLRRMAKAMGEDEAVELLDENLKQEKETLQEVEKIATRLSNESAKEASAA